MPAKKLPEWEWVERLRIGATIRAIRQARQLSADQVANVVSQTYPLSRPFLVNIEAGRRGLPVDLLPALAAALGCDELAIVRPDYFTDAAGNE